jgi:ribosomal protein S18 acetylase RimI-like enzyme
MAGDADEEIVIRRWHRHDREAVQDLLRLLSPDAEVKSDDAPTYVATCEDKVVGMVTLCVYMTLTGPKGYLDHLVVASEWRRRGIGRALVQRAIDRARDAGASRVDLTANDQKLSGRALYESLGFRRRDTGSFRLQL